MALLSQVRCVDTQAIIYGTVVTILLSCTMVVAGLKAGITPGVSPLVVLCGWGAFQKVATAGTSGKRFLNLAQVAGSSGMAVVSGVIFSEPLLQVLYLNLAQASLEKQAIQGDLKSMPWKEAQTLMAAHDLSIPEVSIPTNVLACLAGSLVGYGFVGLTTKRFLSDPSLPAPEAHACTSMINAAASKVGERPRLLVSLVLSLVASLVLRVLALLGVISKAIVFLSTASGRRSFVLEVSADNGPLYMGIGGLLSPATALLTFVGALLRLVGDYLLAEADLDDEVFPANSMRWVGGGAMTVAVLFGLLKFLGAKKATRQDSASRDDDELLLIGTRTRWALMWAVNCGLAAIAVWLFCAVGFSEFSFAMLAALLGMTALMVPLGAVLSLQIGSSSSPVSGTVFVTTLALCAVALASGHDTDMSVPTITTLLVTACVAVCAANDASQDYKTLQLCGLPPREGFLAQIIGLAAASLAVPCSLYVSNNAFGLGTDRLPAPQGQMFATLVDGLLLQDQLPWYPIFAGLFIGLVAVMLDSVGARAGLQLPAMAVAVGIYLSPDTGVGILLGSLFRAAGEHLRKCRVGKSVERTHESVLASAGMITGSAFLDLVVGVAVLAGLDPASLDVVTGSGAWERVQSVLAGLCLLALGCILLYNEVHAIPVGPSQQHRSLRPRWLMSPLAVCQHSSEASSDHSDSSDEEGDTVPGSSGTTTDTDTQTSVDEAEAAPELPTLGYYVMFNRIESGTIRNWDEVEVGRAGARRR